MIGKRLDELERVIELYQDALFRFAFFRTGSLADSQDIVQNVFLKMVDSSRDLAHVGDLKNYLFRCVSNACCDWTEKRRHTGTLSLESVGVADETDTEEEWMHEYVRIGSMLHTFTEKTVNHLLVGSIVCGWTSVCGDSRYAWRFATDCQIEVQVWY